MKIRLKKIELEDKEKLLDMFKEYEESEPIPNIDKYEGIRSFEFLKKMSFEDWLIKIKNDEVNCPKDFSPHTLYMAIDKDNEVVGLIDNRWKEIPILIEFGGLIGYSIRPTKRGNGYATLMLKLSLDKMWEYGKEEVLITCKDFNIASKRTIEKNGGIFIEEYYNKDDGFNYLKYNISKEKKII